MKFGPFASVRLIEIRFTENKGEKLGLTEADVRLIVCEDIFGIAEISLYPQNLRFKIVKIKLRRLHRVFDRARFRARATRFESLRMLR